MAKATNKLVYGVGLNDANYSIRESEVLEGRQVQTWICPYYVRWKSMLERCYNKNKKEYRPTYMACYTVCEWNYFMRFRAWMVQQDWEGKHLDKDLLFPGNKVYSPDTCVFIEPRINSFITENRIENPKSFTGVTFDPRRNSFVAKCREGLKQKYLGSYATAEQAHEAWLTYKLQKAHILAAEQTDPRVAAALIDRYENYAKYFAQPT